MTAQLTYRPARPDDLPTCTEIWSLSIEDYVRRLNQPWFSGDPEPLTRLLAHFQRTDPDRFWVATEPAHADRRDRRGGDHGAGERVVGFGSANQRGSVWFLGMLFVLPKFQGAGVGRRLLEHVMPPGASRATDNGLTLGTATDSVQPISNALYSQYGMVPRLPVFNLVGRPDRPEALPTPAAGISIAETGWPESAAEAADVAAVDRATLGFAHPADHAFLAAEGRRRFIARSANGEALGYGYMAPSGRFGPVAAIDPTLLAPITGHLLASVRAAGAYATWVPGAADELLVALLRAGFRFESFPALYLWNRPIADFSRYLPINLALL